MEEKEYRQLQEDLAVGKLKLDLLLNDLTSANTQEINDAVEQVRQYAVATDEAMRSDFRSLPPHLRQRLLGLLAEHGSESRDWWERYLSGEEVE